MRIGELNRRITLQSPTRVADNMGGYTITWTDEADVWAAIWPVRAAEQIQAAQTVMAVTHRIRMRYYAIEPSWRVQFGDRYFAIVSIVDPNESHRLLDLLCREAAS